MSRLREDYQSGSAGYAPFTVNDCLIRKCLRDENHVDKKVCLSNDNATSVGCGGMT